MTVDDHSGTVTVCKSRRGGLETGGPHNDLTEALMNPTRPHPLARGALRRPLRMRLDIDRWSATSTALTLIPCQRVRPGDAYFRAGRALLDSLTGAARALASTAAVQPRQHVPAPRPSEHSPAGSEPALPGIRQPVPAA